MKETDMNRDTAHGLLQLLQPMHDKLTEQFPGDDGSVEEIRPSITTQDQRDLADAVKALQKLNEGEI